MVTRRLREGGMHRGGGKIRPRARGIPHLAQHWHRFGPLERKKKAKDQRGNRNVKWGS